jgi:uncharacterized membrane protein
MIYKLLTIVHLATLIPAFAIGSIMLLLQKGTRLHKSLGRIYILLMLITCVASLGMQAQIGPKFLGHFGWIHLLSLISLAALFSAFYAIRRGDVKAHKTSMLALYVGGFLIAGTFAFMPGRLLHAWFF